MHLDVPDMSDTHAESGRSGQRLTRRRQRRENAILRQVNALYTEDRTNIYILFHHPSDGTYRGFISQQDGVFPRLPEQLRLLPDILDPTTIGPFLHGQQSPVEQQHQPVPSESPIFEPAPPMFRSQHLLPMVT